MPTRQRSQHFLPGVAHHHLDHIGGLDQLWIGGWTYGRKLPLRVWGPPGTDSIAEHLRGM